MSLFSRLARNSLWLLIARVGVQVSMVIVTYLLARRLGIAGFGEYSFIAAAIVMGNTLTTFGSDMYLIREIASGSEFSRLSSALVVQLTLSSLFIISVFLFAPFLPNQTPESILALRVYSFALIPLAFFTVFTSALRGRQNMNVYAWLTLSISVLQVAGILIFIPSQASIVVLAYLLLIVQVAGTILGGILCILNFPGFWKNWHFSLNETISLVIACVPIAVIAILGILYQKLSLTMLSFLGSASMLGWFSAAARAMEAARVGHIAAFTVLYPAMAIPSDANEDLARTFRLSWLLLIVVAGGVTILLFFLAKPLVDIFFGMDYVPSIPVLKILSFTLIPYTINSFLSLVFLAAKEEKVIVCVLLISLLILVVSNLWLIPRAGQIGAGFAILITETIQSGLLLFVWKMIPSLKAKGFILHKGVSHELSDLSQ